MSELVRSCCVFVAFALDVIFVDNLIISNKEPILIKLGNVFFYYLSQFRYITVDLVTPIVVLAMLAILAAPDKILLSAASPPDLLSRLEFDLSSDRLSPAPFDELC